MGYPKDIERALSKLPEGERLSFERSALQAALTNLRSGDRLNVKIVVARSFVVSKGVVAPGDGLEIAAKVGVEENKRA